VSNINLTAHDSVQLQHFYCFSQTPT